MTPKAQAVRAQINKWNSIKLKSSAQQRKPSIDERQPTKQERRAANHTSDEELTSKTYKEFIQFNGKNTNNLILKWAGVPIVAQWIMNLTSIMRLQVRSLALLSGLRIRCCCCGWDGIPHCCGQQLQLQFDPLAWELPHATGVALKRKQKIK